MGWTPRKDFQATENKKAFSLQKILHTPNIMSEALKMCIIGLDKRWDDRQLSDVFKGRSIGYSKVSKRRNTTVGFVTFENEEQKKLSIPLITEIQGLKGRKLIVDNVTNKSKKSQGRRKREEFAQMGPEDSKRQKLESSLKTSKDAVTPNWRTKYEDQLLSKEDAIVKSLKNIRRKARKDIHLPIKQLNQHPIV